MPTLTLETIPYSPDSSPVYEQLLNLKWPVFLDSCQPDSEQGRFDILTAEPTTILETINSLTHITSQGKHDTSTENPLTLLQKAVGTFTETEHELPFIGGALGYMSYDLGRRFERISEIATADLKMPTMVMGIYYWAVVIDHAQKKSYLCHWDHDEWVKNNIQQLRRRITIACSHPPEPYTKAPFTLKNPFTAEITKQQYRDAFNQIQSHIQQGNCYEVNLTQRFQANIQGDSWHGYKRLRQQNPSPYSAYLRYPFGEILSLSPERFLQVRNRQVESKPIKGTVPRSRDRKQDQKNKEKLLKSTKDHAENIMIVDLMRNDIGRVCKIGSVKTERLCQVESFPAVHHLVSTVTGELHHRSDLYQLIQACFPGGSITGAPKISAMEIIEQLEPVRRAVYCGSIGYISLDGQMDLNISIRTLTHHDNHLYCNAGGAITIDSVVEEEYAECLQKMNRLINLS